MNPVAAGASFLLPKDKFTKSHVDDHVDETILPRNFEKLHKTHLVFHKMEAEGTAKFIRSPMKRSSVYGFNEIHVQHLEKWKADLEDLTTDYTTTGGRPATKDRLGPVYEIGFCAAGLGVEERRKSSAKKEGGEGKKTQVLLHDHFTFSDDRYVKNKDRLWNNNQKRKVAAGAAPPATDAAGAAPLPTVKQGEKRPRFFFEPDPPPPPALSAETSDMLHGVVEPCSGFTSTELRVDPADGNPYSKVSFLEFYGPDDGHHRWAAAPVLVSFHTCPDGYAL
jgi:hypothetical protein